MRLKTEEYALNVFSQLIDSMNGIDGSIEHLAGQVAAYQIGVFPREEA
jgi:hypothetical protein